MSGLGDKARRWFAWGALVVLGVGVYGCRRGAKDFPVGAIVGIQVPLGLPPVPIPKDNPPTAAAIALGRKLFYDKRLSEGEKIACAFCHRPEADFTDGLSLSKGVAGLPGVRNAPTIENAAYLPLQFWDGRALSLEEQAASPIADPLEMNAPHNVSVEKLGRDPEYRAMFRATFGTEKVNLTRVEKALASFERTVLVGNSAFDRYAYGGDASALTAQQVRGLAVFKDEHRGTARLAIAWGIKVRCLRMGSFTTQARGLGMTTRLRMRGATIRRR